MSARWLRGCSGACSPIQTENGLGGGFVAWTSRWRELSRDCQPRRRGAARERSHDLAQGEAPGAVTSTPVDLGRSGGHPHRGSTCRRLAAVAELPRSQAAHRRSTPVGGSPCGLYGQRHNGDRQPRHAVRSRPMRPQTRSNSGRSTRSTDRATWWAILVSGGGRNINFAVPISSPAHVCGTARRPQAFSLRLEVAFAAEGGRGHWGLRTLSSPWALFFGRKERHGGGRDEGTTWQRSREAGLKRDAEWAARLQAQMVDLKFCDLLGTWQHVTLPIAALRRVGVRRGPRLRRLLDPRLAGDLESRTCC